MYYTGTSGFAYKEWKGTFYPEDLPNDGMLAFYGQHFRSVEINNTFYRMPKDNVLLNWAEQVPDGFHFVLKASRRITHIHRLKEADGVVEFLLKQASLLGPKQGPILFQLPPNMKQDLPRLEAFLGLLPTRRVRAAFEFRHDTWYDEAVYGALRAHNAALCLADTNDKPAPKVATADWGYLRLRRAQYDAHELQSWLDWIADQSWSDTYTFFKHEDSGAGPDLAKAFIQAGANGEQTEN